MIQNKHILELGAVTSLTFWPNGDGCETGRRKVPGYGSLESIDLGAATELTLGKNLGGCERQTPNRHEGGSW